MALTFGGATSDRSTATIAAAAVNLGALTMWAFIFPTTLANGRGILSTCATDAGADTGYRNFAVRSTGQLDFSCNMNTTETSVRSTNGAGHIVAVSKWWFVAVTVTSAFVPKLYLADLSIGATVTETTYATQVTGASATVTDSGGVIKIGNRNANALAFQGRIAIVGYENTDLSLGQLKSLAYSPRRLASNVYFAIPGFNGTTNVPDLSGNGQVGTITGATVAAHVPLAPLFGEDNTNAYRLIAAAPWTWAYEQMSMARPEPVRHSVIAY